MIHGYYRTLKVELTNQRKWPTPVQKQSPDGYTINVPSAEAYRLAAR